jgi:hypothetical protein
MTNITENGEITFDPKTELFTVWDETYAGIVTTTRTEEGAYEALYKYAASLDEKMNVIN